MGSKVFKYILTIVAFIGVISCDSNDINIDNREDFEVYLNEEMDWQRIPDVTHFVIYGLLF